jgi:argininosuccinate lyase
VEFDLERMREAASRGWLTATEAADYLVRRGVPFRQAHDAAGRVVRAAAERKVPLWSLPLEDYRSAHPAFEADVLEAVTLEASVEGKRVEGGTARQAVVDQLAALRQALEQDAAWRGQAEALLQRAGRLTLEA